MATTSGIWAAGNGSNGKARRGVLLAAAALGLSLVLGGLPGLTPGTSAAMDDRNLGGGGRAPIQLANAAAQSGIALPGWEQEERRQVAP